MELPKGGGNDGRAAYGTARVHEAPRQACNRSRTTASSVHQDRRLPSAPHLTRGLTPARLRASRVSLALSARQSRQHARITAVYADSGKDTEPPFDASENTYTAGQKDATPALALRSWRAKEGKASRRPGAGEGWRKIMFSVVFVEKFWHGLTSNEGARGYSHGSWHFRFQATSMEAVV